MFTWVGRGNDKVFLYARRGRRLKSLGNTGVGCARTTNCVFCIQCECWISTYFEVRSLSLSLSLSCCFIRTESTIGLMDTMPGVMGQVNCKLPSVKCYAWSFEEVTSVNGKVQHVSDSRLSQHLNLK
jgi:hypothetical protein